MSATVTWSPPGGAPRSCTFDRTCALGRGLRNRILLTGAGVSRSHATLTLAADGLHLRNVSASQDVGVNGKRLAPGGMRRLEPGDRLRIGDTELEIAEVETDASTVRCVKLSCRRDVSTQAADCPWCGTSLAFASTRSGPRL
ncbi:MAG: putative component of type VI protein secretion system [Myxococcota bacterium]|jgi:predicted component of type VI protein secretion system